MPDPTVTDVFNQLVLVNGKLDQIDTNTFSQTAALNTLNANVNTAINTLNTIAQINIEAVKLIFHQTQQADAMICILDQISKNTCEILNQVTVQTALQTKMNDNIDAMRFYAESDHPAAALERQRLAALQAEIERCCPPPRPDPACKFDPCDRPKPADKPDLPQIDEPKEPNRPVG